RKSRSSTVGASAPRRTRLGWGRTWGGLAGKLVQIETFLSNPQVEIEQGDRDGSDRRDQRVHAGRDREHDGSTQVIAQAWHDGRESTEQRGERGLNDADKNAHENQDAQRPPPVSAG